MSNDESGDDYLARCFEDRVPPPGAGWRHAYLRAAAHHLARVIAQVCPANNDRDMAIHKVREAVMWAHSAIVIGRYADCPTEQLVEAAKQGKPVSAFRGRDYQEEAQ